MVQEQTPESNPPDEEKVESQNEEAISQKDEGGRDVEQVNQPTEKVEGSELALEEINRITGRSFKSTDEACEHYKNLESFVGQNPEAYKRKAEVTDKLVETWKQAGYTEEEALEEIQKGLGSFDSQSMASPDTMQPTEDRRMDGFARELRDLRIKDETREIINQRPEFAKMRDKIMQLSLDTGKNPSQVVEDYILPAYEGLKDSAYQSQKVKEETKISPSETVSEDTTSALKELRAKAEKTGKDEDWQAYIKEKFK
jgi:hypothetical protein